MTTLGFWNTNLKRIPTVIAELAVENQIDLLALAESTSSPALMLECLNSKESRFRYYPSPGCDKIQLYGTFPNELLHTIYERDWLTIRHLQLPGLISVLIVAAHFPSKLFWDEPSQDSECVEFSRLIREAEAQVGHARTILVADLNMNPFQTGVVSANGLHGVMSRSQARRRVRKVHGIEYPMFYNPMWNLFGDETKGPPGTYFSGNAVHRSYFWNMLDQVLVRPDLLDCFRSEELQIIERVGGRSLLRKSGIPNDTDFSDHLPLIFKLDL